VPDTPLPGEQDDDRALLDAVQRALSQAERSCGDRLQLGRGCPRCCYGPFPINLLDARRLRRGLAGLALRGPEAARAIVQRARRSAVRFAPTFPGVAGTLGADDSAVEAFCAAFAAEPCPALEPSSGRCQLYESRPLACRTFGLPVRIGEQDLPPCDWCFTGTEDDAAAARAAVDPEGREDALLTRLEAQVPGGDTVIAYALAGEP
jgi:Fe-S-cluster containining protein